LAVEIKNQDIAKVQALFSEIKAFFTKSFPDPSVVSLAFEGNLLNIGINFSSILKQKNFLEEH